jgi:hypothetical protein
VVRLARQLVADADVHRHAGRGVHRAPQPAEAGGRSAPEAAPALEDSDDGPISVRTIFV